MRSPRRVQGQIQSLIIKTLDSIRGIYPIKEILA